MSSLHPHVGIQRYDEIPGRIDQAGHGISRPDPVLTELHLLNAMWGALNEVLYDGPRVLGVRGERQKELA